MARRQRREPWDRSALPWEDDGSTPVSAASRPWEQPGATLPLEEALGTTEVGPAAADATELDPTGPHSVTEASSELIGMDDSMASLLRHLAGAPTVSPEELQAQPVLEGERVGRFEVLRELGKGGFANVYEALDLSLGRRVAIKVLRMRRREHNHAVQSLVELFHQEAATIAQLNHPNIVTLHDYGSFEGLPYLVLERLEGETLRQRLGRGPLDLNETLTLMEQVASALAYAHRAGVVHRDLKPSNIFLATDGRVKVLDLGLARVMGALAAMPEGSAGTTTQPSSRSDLDGAGTPGYMAPEQWLRQDQDARTDVFAAGVVLFQLLTGVLPLSGRARGEPPSPASGPPAPSVRERCPHVPQVLSDLVARCLEREPACRFADGAQLRDALRDARLRVLGGGALRLPVAGPWRWAALALALLLALGLGLAVLLRGRPHHRLLPPPRHRRLTYVGDASSPALSPDGTLFAFVSQGRVYIQGTFGGPAREIYRGKHVDGLRWTPDGLRLLFFSWGDDVAGAYVVPREGGRPVPVPKGERNKALSPPGLRPPTEVRLPARRRHRRRFVLPGTFAWMDDMDWSARGGIVALHRSAGRSTLWVLDAAAKKPRLIYTDANTLSSVRWAPGARAVYVLRTKGGTSSLLRVPVWAPGAAGARPAPTPVLTGLQWGPTISLSADGRRLLYTRVSRFSHVAVAPVPVGPSPAPLAPRAVTPGTLMAHSPSPSPDGRWLAFSVGERPVANLFLMPLAGGPLRQLTFGEWWNEGATWSPDGDRIAFGSQREGLAHVWTVRVSDGTLRSYPEARLDAEGHFDLQWAPSRWIVHQLPGRRLHRRFNPVTGVAGLVPLHDLSGRVHWPRISPDGRLLAVYRDLKRRRGLWVIQMPGGGERRLQGGHVLPIGWSADGRSIYLGRRTDLSRCPTGPIRHIERIDARTGRVLKRFPISPERVVTHVSMTADERHFVFTIEDVRSDVWLLEDFDAQEGR